MTIDQFMYKLADVLNLRYVDPKHIKVEIKPIKDAIIWTGVGWHVKSGEFRSVGVHVRSLDTEEIEKAALYLAGFPVYNSFSVTRIPLYWYTAISYRPKYGDVDGKVVPKEYNILMRYR